MDRLKNYMDVLKRNAHEGETAESILSMLYDVYSERHNLDNDQTNRGFGMLYEAMSGMTLRDMDRIIDPVCALCRSNQRSGFIDGIKIGIRLANELSGDIAA